MNLPHLWPGLPVSLPTGEEIGGAAWRTFLSSSTLVGGVVVGAGDATVEWVRRFLAGPGPRRLALVLAVEPAGPTSRRHLESLLNVVRGVTSESVNVEVRILPLESLVQRGRRLVASPPSVIQAYDQATGRCLLSFGSVGDMGSGPVLPGSVNCAFLADVELRAAWRRWFQRFFEAAAPLDAETARIPDLVVPRGSEGGATAWEDFKATCARTTERPEDLDWLDTASGSAVGNEGEPAGGTPASAADWDGGALAPDVLADEMRRVYASGWLVSVDEASRIKPLQVPVKATLLGQEAERMVGRVRQKQSFTLQVLDDVHDRAFESCRKVHDLLELLAFSLSQGVRWVPDAARALLQTEIETRERRGREVLLEQLGAATIEDFLEQRSTSIRRDLDGMYRELTGRPSVPEEKVRAVLDDVRARLKHALEIRVTPDLHIQPIAPPALGAGAPDANWNQPLQLLQRCARVAREWLTNPYFDRRFSGVGFNQGRFFEACDVFGDIMFKLKPPSPQRARDELSLLDSIVHREESSRRKCEAVLDLIRGTG